MKPLRLFTAFHANLDFSAIPEADRGAVIERCYWPLLSLPDSLGIRIGIELTTRTLELLEGEDPEWVKRFIGLAECGLVEPIASGRAQVVAPLAPTEVNRLNLKLGGAQYHRLLGFAPDTYLVNEQTWSDGLALLYHEAGAKRVIMEWNNPASKRRELRALRCRAARLRVGSRPGPALLFNDSIVFQKMQRAAQGETPPSDVLDYVEKLALTAGAENLCLYGGDVEIFDYRPSRSLPSRGDAAMGEMDRLISIFRTLAEDERFEFVLPREVVDERASLPSVTLGSSEDPIPCKKQPRYNPTRWAVSGRDGFGMNTRCHALLRKERAVRRLAKGESAGLAPSALVDLWRSDFRTRATEEKVVEFESSMGLAEAQSKRRLESLVPGLPEGEDLLIVNPDSRPWEGMPVEIPLRFPPGRHPGIAPLVRRGAPLAADQAQVEVTGRHRDGTLRRATLVIEPTLGAGETLGIELVSTAGEVPAGETLHEVHSAGTDCVEAKFLPHRGAALASLRFPSLESSSLLGTIAHGHFDEMAYTPDFYSGHVVALDEHHVKRTDLSSVRLGLDKERSGPVRLTLATAFDSPFGPWRKQYRLYRNTPRLDLEHDLSFHDARLASLRLGAITLQPGHWDRDSLRYGTVNGGAGVEWRGFPGGVGLEQSSAVSSAVTATSCLGATEGWVAIADRTRGLLVSGDRAAAAVVPLLDFKEVDGSFFCRLAHSAAESDETRASFLRGRLRFGFAIEGFAPDDHGVTERARLRHHGLIYRTETGVGLTNGI